MSAQYVGEVEGELRITADCHNNVIRNNILYARPNRGVLVNKQTTDGSNNSIDFNLYFSTALQQWNWDNVAYSDIETWKGACGGDANSTANKDPQLVSATLPDLHIGSNSPAKNSGTFVSGTVNGERESMAGPELRIIK